MARRLLDLFCGGGGATRGYQDAGFYVVGVDLSPQPSYCGDHFIQDDAIEFLRWAARKPQLWDAVHASPPCQRHSSITQVAGRADEHPELIAPTRRLLRRMGVPYVIENVPRSPLRDPVTVCAKALGRTLDEGGRHFILRRHRLFETSFPVEVPPCTCKRGDGVTLGIYGGGGGRSEGRVRNRGGGNTQKANRDQAAELMGIDWLTRTAMCQAIPPAYTELVGRQLLEHLEAE